jgi:Ca2+-binding RTX toxin-like protein
LLLALGAAISLALFPQAAIGATAFVEGTPGQEHLFYVAAAGETNQLEVTRNGAGTTFRDAGAVITPGSGCTSVDPNEVFCPGSFEARVSLGDGDDDAAVLEGGGVLVLGGPGDDELSACGDCSSPLQGRDGADTLVGSGFLGGGAGNDIITGNPDFRAANGGQGDDTITGGDGDSSILPGKGDDTIVARGGDDRILLWSGRDDVDGGPGRDFVDLHRAWAPVVVDLRRDRAIVGDGRKRERIRLARIEDIRGTGRPDRLIGDGHDNVLDGGGGRDELIGNRGDDVFRTGDGVVPPRSSGIDDFLRGGAGDDLLQASRGDDYLVGGSGNDRIEGQAGDDVILARDGESDVVRGGRQLDRAGVDPNLDDVRDVEIFF